jgi:CRP-like cAMP-binding protein
MSHKLFKHIAEFAEVTESDFAVILPYFRPQGFSKKEHLMSNGDKCQYNYFVLEGCLQLFFTDPQSNNKTIQFALENWWITDILAYLNQARTEFTIQAVEPTKVLRISFEQQEEVMTKFPELEKYFRVVYQIGYGASQVRFRLYAGFSKEERYFNFVNRFPEFAQRVPQYLIASFLDLTPEYVSQLRAKKLS